MEVSVCLHTFLTLRSWEEAFRWTPVSQVAGQPHMKRCWGFFKVCFLKTKMPQRRERHTPDSWCNARFTQSSSAGKIAQRNLYLVLLNQLFSFLSIMKDCSWSSIDSLHPFIAMHDELGGWRTCFEWGWFLFHVVWSVVLHCAILTPYQVKN